MTKQHHRRPRRIKFNYRRVNIDELAAWLDDNGVDYTLIPPQSKMGEIGNLIFLLEIYSARDETAIRIKWETV